MKPLCRVMIVDDEMLVRQGIKHLIDWEREGCRVVAEAANGLEALKLIEKLDPHVILTDIVMPVMGGEEFVRLVKEKYPHIEIIVLSSFSDFDYVRSTFQSGAADYLLKPKLEAEELLSLLRRVAVGITATHSELENTAEDTRLDQTLERLIAGYEAELDPVLIANHFSFSQYALFGAERRHNPQHVGELSWDDIDEGLRRLGLENFAYRRIGMSPGISPPSVLYVLNLEAEEWDRLLLELRLLVEAVHREQPEDRHFVLGPSFVDLNQLGTMYRNHYVKLASRLFYLPDRRLLEPDDLLSLPETIPAFDLVGVTEQLKRRQFREAFTEFLAYIRQSAASGCMDVFEFKTILGNFIFNVLTVLSKMKYPIQHLEAAKYDYFRGIDEAVYARDAIHVAEAFLQKAEQAIEEVGNISNPNIAMLLDYIHDHYAEPITLADAARQLHFNASYLSSYFTAHQGEGFNEYLNKVRLEKAMELLQTTDLSISQISTDVGYADQSYFTKVFKKWAGMSPSRYRRLRGVSGELKKG